MLTEGSAVPAAESLLSKLLSVQETLADNLRRAKEIQRLYFNHRAREGPVYHAGDWVWLLRRNIATTRPLTKLDFKRLGPFRIDLPMGRDVYRLILPPDLSRLHPVFHVSLLLPFTDPKSFPGRLGSKAPLGPALLKVKFWDESDVEALLGYRSPAKKVHQYLVRWRVGSTADDSWVNGSDFDPILHPHMTQLHDTFGGAKLILLPQEKIIRIPC